MNTKTLNEITGKILDCEDKIEGYQYKLEYIQEGKNFHAPLHLDVGSRRTSSVEWLSKEEVIAVLERRLSEEKTQLELLKKSMPQ